MGHTMIDMRQFEQDALDIEIDPHNKNEWVLIEVFPNRGIAFLGHAIGKMDTTTPLPSMQIQIKRLGFQRWCMGGSYLGELEHGRPID